MRRNLVCSIIGVLSLVGCWQGPSHQDAVDNYTVNREKIDTLVQYFISVTPSDRDLSFFIHDDEIVSIGWSKNDSISGYTKGGIEELKFNSPQMDSLLEELGWSDDVPVYLSEYLAHVNCTGISGKNPVELVFESSGLGVYSYLIYSNPMTDSLKLKHEEIVGDSVLNANVVLRYGSGL